LIVLAVTGLSLKYHDTAWGRFMIELEGGLEGRGLIHRIAAVILVAVSLYHYGYTLISRRGQELFQALLPRQGDLHRAFQGIRYNLGLMTALPDWDRFTFFQKAQYFGVIAGVISLTVTGLVLWMGPQAVALAPKWLVDLTLVIHGYEGLLIFIILLFWHFYNVHLSPGNFPMNRSWITGRISLSELKEKHPAEYRRLAGREEIRE
jgi:cytochrome b subunit of formate dehydrogenase